MHNGLHLLDNEPLKECSRNGANYLRRSLVLGNYIGSSNPAGAQGNIIYDGGGIEDFAFDGSKDVKVQVDRTVVRTFGYQSITGYKDFINTVRINHLIVTGQQDIEHVRDLYVGDPLISLNSGIKDVSSTNNGYDLGLALQRGSADKNVGFIWDENPPAEATAHEGGEFAFISSTEDGSTKGDVTVEDYLDIRLGNLNVEKDSKSKGSFYLTGENFDITVDNEVHDVEQNVLWDIEGNETHEVNGNLKLDIESDYNVEVNGNSILDVEGNLTQHVKGAVTITGDSISLTSNDETHTVLDDYILNVTDDHTVNVGGDSLVDVEGNETHDVEGNLTQNVAGDITITGDNITLTSNNETHNVEVDLNYDVEGNVIWDIEGGETHNVNQNVLWDIEGNETHDVEGNLTQNVAGNVTITGDNVTFTSNNETHNVGDDYILNVTDDHTVNVGGDSHLDVDGNVLNDIEGNVTNDIEGDVTWDVNKGITYNVQENVSNNVIGNVTNTIGGDVTNSIVGNVNYDAVNFSVNTTNEITLISEKEIRTTR